VRTTRIQNPDPAKLKEAIRYVVEEALSGLPLAGGEIRFRMRNEAWLCAHSCHRQQIAAIKSADSLAPAL